MPKINLADEWDETLIRQELAQDGELNLVVPMPSINSANSYLDICDDYLTASYVLERIAPTITEPKLKFTYSDYRATYQLKASTFEKTKLAEHLKELIWAYRYPETPDDEVDFMNLRSAILDYEIELTSSRPCFPSVVDDYFANVINGAYYELEFDAFSSQLTSYPERKLGFWRAAGTFHLEEPVYVSSTGWVVPVSLSLDRAAEILDYKGQVSLLSAELTMLKGSFVACTEGFNLGFNLKSLAQALSCADLLRTDATYFEEAFTWLTRASELECHVSEYRDCVVLRSPIAWLFLFEVHSVDTDKVRAVYEELEQKGGDGIFSPADIALPWNALNDELFELLCYDLIYNNPVFDNTTIRKMGKARSRDGGRDIVVFTRPKSGKAAKKFIFQCKLKDPNSSVSAGNVGPISDVIEQYKADGYGIMCNCYIDSTLYDRLDGIGESRNVKISTWSKFEIERFVARRPFLRERHFASK